MQAKLGDAGKYSMNGLDSSFYMLVGEVWDLHEILYVLGITKELLLVSCLIDLKCKVDFDDEGVIIRRHSLILVEF
jgi:hypothetical protein